MPPGKTRKSQITVEETVFATLAKLAEEEQLTLSGTLQKIIGTYSELSAARRRRLQRPTSRSPDGSVPADASGPLISWEDPRGTITFTPTGKRLFLMTARAWVLHEERVFSNLLKGAPPMIFEMGRAYGEALALEFGSIGQEPGKISKYLEQMCAFTGWGRITIDGDLASGRKITVKVDNCIFCSTKTSNATGRNSCYFLMGVSKGIMDSVFDWPHTVRETACCLRGDDYCELIIESKAEFENGKKEWGFKVYFPAQASITRGYGGR